MSGFRPPRAQVAPGSAGWAELSRVADPDLRAALTRRHVVMAVGRHTGNCPDGVAHAVDDLRSALELADRQLGTAFAASVDRTELVRRLRAQKPHVAHTRDGGIFTNRFLVVDLEHSHGLVVVVSAGSGPQEDALVDRLNVRYHADRVRQFRPSLLVCTHAHSLGRFSWSLSALVDALRHSQCHLLSQTSGPTQADDLSGLLRFFEPKRNREQDDEGRHDRAHSTARAPRHNAGRTGARAA